MDATKAAEWYRAAVKAGDPNAMFSLAMFALQGRGGMKDPKEGVRLLDRAAQRGHPLAAYDLGLLYLQGQQVDQDEPDPSSPRYIMTDAGIGYYFEPEPDQQRMFSKTEKSESGARLMISRQQ